MKSLKLIRGENETEDQFWKRYESKLKELDYQSVNIHGDYITINHN